MKRDFWTIPIILLAIAAGAATKPAGNAILPNGGFEFPTLKEAGDKPDEWKTFARDDATMKIQLTRDAAHSGKQSVRLASAGSPDGYEGIYESIPVRGGATYHYVVYVRGDSSAPLRDTNRGQISIEWKDAGGNEIDRTWGPDFASQLSSDQWQSVEMIAKAPASAARAHFVITLHEGKAPGGGAFYADDAAVIEQP